MTTNLATPGLILKGRHDSNDDRRMKVWALHPTNPKRVLLWGKSGNFSWNNVASLAVNYEEAPADEPTWPDPTREPPPDPKDTPKAATPVETVAASPEPAPTVDHAEDVEVTPSPPPAPPPPPMAKTSAPAPSENDSEEVRIVLRGDSARVFQAILNDRREVLADLGGDTITPESLVRGFMRMELRRLGKEVA